MESQGGIVTRTRMLLVVLAMIIPWGLVGSPPGAEAAGTTEVTFFNAIPDTAVDVYVDGTQVVANLAELGSASRSVASGGAVPVTVFVAGDDPSTDLPLADQTLALPAGTRVAAVIFPVFGGGAAIAVTELPSVPGAPPDGRIVLEDLIDVPNLRIEIDGTIIFEGTPEASGTWEGEVPAGLHTLSIYRADTGQLVYEDSSLELDRSVRYAVFLVYDASAGTYDVVFQVVPIPAPADTYGTVTAVHAIPNTTVDVYIDNAKVLPAVPPGAVAGSIVLPALAPRTNTVQIYETGAVPGLDEPLVTGTYTLASGDNISIVAHQLQSGEPTISVFGNDITTLGHGMARLEIRHTAAAPPVTIRANDQVVFRGGNGAVASVEIPAGTYDVEIQLGSLPPFPLPTPLEAEAGNSYLVQAMVGAAPLPVVPLIGTIEGLGPETSFAAPLSGLAEVPPVIGTGGGLAAFQLLAGEENTAYRLILENVRQVTGAHIHLGSRGENGPVVATLFPPAGGPLRSSGIVAEGVIDVADLTPQPADGFDGSAAALRQRLRTGTAYVNVHTADQPGGEVRGPIVPLDVPVDGGLFVDDDGTTHEANIDLIGAAGITKGCNPPDNDQFCGNDPIRRGEMAAFLRRAFGLPPSSTDAFADDDGTLFEGDIDALAAVGITKGCNPPDNDRFCPDDEVSRGQMAAFLNRALLGGTPPPPSDSFVDDDDSIFEADIEAIAAAGITKGCNPPDNDRFCPDDPVSRAEMASFLARSFGWGN